MGVRRFGHGAVRGKLFANRMIKVFTPSFVDHSNINAQNLAVNEGVTRIDSSRFHVVMLGASAAGPRTSYGSRPGKGARYLC
jgi:hypothetical protein